MTKLTLTQDDMDTINFVGHRYGWSDLAMLEVGTNEIEEHELWEWKDAVENDDAMFTLLNPNSELFEKLFNLYDSII